MKRSLLYLPIVGVMGGGETNFRRFSSDESYKDSAPELGRALAELGWNLLTGGGTGAMQAVTKAYQAQRRQKGVWFSLALLPKGNANIAGADIAIATPLPGSEWDSKDYLVGDSRNHLNVRLADLIVGLPGGPGTLSELRLAVQHGKPCIAFLRDEAEDRIGNDSIGEKELAKLGIEVARTIADVKRFLRKNRPRLIRPVKHC
jgi:predicted Rossmann-fold nucleotide-binding protein